jgi:NADH oxidase (H2O2-forming)
MRKYEVLVVGGGPAAITLAKMLGGKKRIALVRPEAHSMIYCAMPYVLEGIMGIEKTLKRDELVTDSGAELIRDTVTGVDFRTKLVTLEAGEPLAYEKLVLATGAVPFIPPVPGSDLKGVSGFKSEKDLATLQQLVASGHSKAVVVGAGAIGVELALALKDAGLRVDLVDLGASVLPNLLDREMTEDIEAEIIRKGVNLHLEAKVVALHGDEWVEQVELDNGRTIRFDARDDCTEASSASHDGIVVFAAGMKPEIDLVRESGMELGRDGIIVNDRMETSIPDVYAAGDCVQFISGINGQVIPGKLATNAVPMAKVLARRILGQDMLYPGFYNGAATKAGGYYAGGTGFTGNAAVSAGFEVTAGYSEVTTQFPIMPGAGKIRIKLIAENGSGTILGAQIISAEPVTAMIDIVTFAIQKKSTVEDLLQLSYSSQPYQSFFPAGNGLVMAAESILRTASVDGTAESA